MRGFERRGLPRTPTVDQTNPDLQLLFRSLYYHGGLVADPPEPRPGEMWLRTDLGEPELRALVGGDVVTLAAVGAAVDADTLQGENGAYYRARANHTGSQLAATISDFAVAALAATAAAYEASGAVAAHVALLDPHLQYLTPAEGAAAYDPIGSSTAAIAAHLLAGDPHPQYLTPAEGSAAYDAAGAAAAAQAAAIASALAAVATHEGDSTNVHGITDTALLVLTSDARLTNARTPTAHALNLAGGFHTGTLDRSQMPSQVAYEDEANTYSLNQAITRTGADASLSVGRASGATVVVEAGATQGFVGTTGAHALVLRQGGNQRWQVSTAGQFTPITDVAFSLGDLTHRILDFHLGRQLLSTVATGTSPFVVASQTLVANLNAGLLGGQNSAYHLSRANHTGTQGWATVDKTGSSLADLATRSAGDLNSGTLADGRLSSNIPRLSAGFNDFVGTVQVADLTVTGSFEAAGGLYDGTVTFNGGMNLDGPVAGLPTMTLGLFGVTPTARAAVRTISNDSSNRILNVSTVTLTQLANFVATMARDMIGYGLYA